MQNPTLNPLPTEPCKNAEKQEKEVLPLFGAPAPDRPRRKRPKVAAGPEGPFVFDVGF